MTQYTLFVEIVIETNDQPPADVRSRLSCAPNRVGNWIKQAAKAATIEAIGLAWPESYFPDWPEGGKLAEIVKVRQYTRRTD